MVPWAARVHIINSISISSVILAQLMLVTNRQTHIEIAIQGSIRTPATFSILKFCDSRSQYFEIENMPVNTKLAL